MAHPAPYRQYQAPGGMSQDPYGPPRGPPARQGSMPIPRDGGGGYNDGYGGGGYDDRNYRYGGPPPQQHQQQQQYPPRGGGPPPQMRRPPPPNGPPRDDFYDRRGPPPQQQDGYRGGAMYQPPPQNGPPRRARPPIQALDLAAPPLEKPRRRPGADEYVALVSPIYDKRFEQMDDRRPYPGQTPSPTNRMPARNGPSPGEPMPTMQFNMAGSIPPPRTKSAPPDDPRNWDRNAPPPPLLDRDQYDDRRGPYPSNMPPLTKRGGGPPSRGGGRPPMDRGPPPQQLYDRGPEPRRRLPPQGPPYDGRGPPSRSNTFPVPNDGYDPRGPPPPRGYDLGPPTRGGPPPPRMDERGYPPDPRRDPRAGNVDQMLDNYIEELGSPQQQYTRPDPRDPRGRPDPRFNNASHPRSPPFSDTAAPQDQYIPPDRRQLAAQVGLPGPPPPGLLPRSQTAPGISDLDRGVQQMDLRRQSPPQLQPQSRSPNKLHKSPGKPTGPVGVQSQIITTPNGNQIDPNALPIFPSPDQTAQTQGGGPPPSERGSYSSDGSNLTVRPRVIEKPKLTLALLEDYRRDAKNNPNDPAIQLDYAKALMEASLVLSQEIGMGDPKRVAKSRENFNAEAYKIVKKLASSGSTGVGKPPYPEAMFFLASCHGEGLMGLPVDLEKAFGLYFSAAKAGHTVSCYRTAMCCECGIGTKRDPQKAMQFYRKAASQGDVGSMYKLGIIMLKGLLGLPTNTREAIVWLTRAAENADEDNPQALNILAQLYEKPDDAVNGIIIQDESYAFELYTKAAQLGHPPSQFKLGVSYEYGNLGLQVDPRKSIAWYSRAAEQSDPEAELALSGWYLTGAEGILPQSDQEAYLWAQKAAEKGLAKAEFAVGYYTETGIGRPPDLQEAKRWYLMAAEQGQKRAMARLAELKRMPNGGSLALNGGGASGGGRRELQKHRGGGGGSGTKEDCLVM